MTDDELPRTLRQLDAEPTGRGTAPRGTRSGRAPSTTGPELSLGLRWGIKRTFLDYVRRMPDGQGSVGDGAVPVGSHEVLWAPELTGARTTDDGVEERFWGFRGDVRFTAHLGMLSVRLADPEVVLRGGAAELTVAGADGGDRLHLVSLTLAAAEAPAGLEVWLGDDVRLMAAGSEVFNDVYPPGEQFEPLTLVLPVTGSPA